jgi:hypothetical protein
MPAKASQGLDLRHQPKAGGDLPVMFRPEPSSVLHGRPSASIATVIVGSISVPGL